MALVPASSSATTSIPPTKELEDAVDEFRKVLTDDQRSELLKLRAKPDANAVLVFTAQLDRSTTQRNCPNKGTRLISVLQFVRESSVIIDTFVSSHPEIAALVWGSIKLTIQVALNFTSYYERVTDLFMQLAKDCPRFAEYQALFPNSAEVQTAICDFNASIILCCKHVIEAVQRPWHKHLQNAFLQSFQQEFNPDLEKVRKCGLEVKQAIKLAKIKADHQDQRLQQMERKAASQERRKVRQLFSRVQDNLYTIKNDQLQQDIRRAEENRRQLLDSLSSYDCLTTYKKACKIRHPRTAEWLFQLAIFTQWEEGTSSPWLWCSGKIGSGKTILTASAIEHVFAHERRARESITFFFPHFADQTPLSAEITLRSIIRQSLDPVRLSSEWEHRLAELKRNPSSELSRLTSLLQETVDQRDVFYVFIDALDEFERSERRALLNSLASVDSESRLRVFLSSRESLSHELQDRVPTIGIVSMASPEASVDIATFVHEKIQERQQNGDFEVQDPSIINDVQRALVSHADGMFLWVAFLLDEICAQICDDDIRNAIQRLPKSLTETLNRALQRIIKHEKYTIANKAFQWIAIAKRPLTINELREAISIEIGQPSSKPGQLVNGIRQLPMWCENLIRVDEESKTVEFAHKAINEFIVRGLSGPDFIKFHFNLEDADHNAGEICVTYLNFSDFVTTVARRLQPVKIDPTRIAYSVLRNSWKLPKSISNVIITKPKDIQKEIDFVRLLATHHRSDDAEAVNTLQDRYPFLKYASVYWISHTTRFRPYMSSSWRMWRQFVAQGHGLAKMPWPSQEDSRALNSNVWPWSFANRHFAIIRLLRSMGELDDTEKAKALQSAAMSGDLDLVDALLESRGATEAATFALQAASAGGRIEVVERLLSAGVNVNADPAGGHNGQTALQAASEGGHIEIVERLLSAGANVNADPIHRGGRTALQAASGAGYIAVVERLLLAGANVNADPIRWGGRTALQAASEGGHIEVVERFLLPFMRVNVNAYPAEHSGRTALQAASEGGHIKVVKRLLSVGADINAYPAEYNGRTALQAASEGGHIEVVEGLLSAKANFNTASADVNARPAKHNGRTALQAASEGGYIKIVEQLLLAGANINADPTKYSGRTALQAASEGGHIKVVERLLSIRAKVNTAAADVNARPARHNGRTALQAASEGGHIKVVERLLSSRAEVNAYPTEYSGRTALQAASEGGHIKVVERLLSAKADVNIKPSEHDGRTALQAASEGGYIKVVKRLLSVGANVNAGPARRGGRTALQAASEGGHLEVVKRLLSVGANVNADPARWGGRTALQAASEGGHFEVVDLLLSAGANVNADPAENNGRTALRAASEGGHVDVIERLLSAGAKVNIYLTEHDGRTALQAASQVGHIKAVELLLSAGANVNADPARWGGRTALQAASEGGHFEVVDLLLSAGANVNADPAYDGRTALQAASDSGYIHVAERLLSAGAHRSG